MKFLIIKNTGVKMLEIQKKLTKSFYAILSLPATAMGFALSVQISALSWILSTKYHLSIENVGFVWAAGPLAGIIAQVLVGFISDKVWLWNGRRRPFILIGGTLAALMLLCLPNLDKIQAWMGLTQLMPVALFVALTLDLSINVSFNPTRSVIADVTPDGNPRTKGYTWMQTISGFFGVLAYVISASTNNYILIYFGLFLVLAFSLVPTFLISEPRELGQAKDDKVKEETKAGKTEFGQLMRIYLAHGFSWLGIQTMFVYIFAYINEVMGIADSNHIGQIIAIAFAILNTVGFILPAPVLEPIAEKIGRVKTHMLCVAIMAFGYLGIVLAGKTPVMVYVFMAVCGIGWASVVSLPFAIATEKVAKSKMGLYMGIFNLSVVIPQLIVSWGFGKIIQNSANKNVIFIISAVTLAISSVLWLLVKDNKAKE
jgi:maltose/moltooligosaccharide transporter